MSKANKVKINIKKRVLFALPPMNRYPSRKEWERASWHKILKSKNLLRLLVTSYERHNLVMRAAVIDGINSGRRHRQIAEELWLSPQTISSIRKALSESSYRSYRERGKTERKKKVYTPGPVSKRRGYRGRPVRTKYGTVYLPYWVLWRVIATKTCFINSEVINSEVIKNNELLMLPREITER